jgi:single-strand DNA-binding protein
MAGVAPLSTAEQERRPVGLEGVESWAAADDRFDEQGSTGMGETYVTLWGNIATDPRRMTTPGGVSILKFRLACTASRRDPQTGDYTDGVTSWYSVACWRDLADNAAGSLAKGDPVVVYGRQVVRDWETEDGKKGTDVSIDAMTLGHDLRRGRAQFNRIKRGSSTTGEAQPGDGPDASTATGADPWAKDGSPELASVGATS